MVFPRTRLNLSGERFTVRYRLLAADEAEARARARGICLEQTVELPEEALVGDDIQAGLVGRIEALRAVGAGLFETAISYAVETAGIELTQLLNVIFGNTSMQPGIRVEELELPDSLLALFKGPRLGRAGLRRLLGVPERPLLATALKPVGLPAGDLAGLARRFALGGIDIIKDDHGLADQSLAPFDERVRRCAEAVAEANAKTGYRCIYVPNVTAPIDRLLERAYLAKEAGVGGLMIAPGLTGWDAERRLAEDDGLALPLFSHPALLGSFVSGTDRGIAQRVVFGQVPRLVGADASIYVNYGGRFAFSREDCRAAAEAAGMPLGRLRPNLPMPGGGMTLDRLPEMYRFYGREIIFLVAGGLYTHGPDLEDTSRRFRELAQELSAGPSPA